MIACIMGKIDTVKELVEQARIRLTPENFKLFINIKVMTKMGGNNALLYACNSSYSNELIVQYLIQKAGADINSMNDYKVNCLLIATKK